ncbi:MAG TPA: DUF4123 domain-containing protein [Marinobacter sp.]|uniref:DUF4123 domain-containing protein n=1 Tax=Marinobacter antarcticus TaxID=564117 RepID=A0A831R2K1_9GAMM|nr:DUF4123 domain-containing protein [Marinobacter antarcticus]HDZ37587.1 DUF4123 domain-containing protein [Marinobacter sp.]HEA52751.1 DUF4123 domain-containing protein [Marinobacter antarcticus]
MSTIAPALPDRACLNTFQEATREWQLQPGQRCLLIVDAAQCDEYEVTKALYSECDDPNWCWLFEDSPLETFADAGPIIVDTVVGSQFCQHALSQWADKGLLFVFTESAVEKAVAGLRGMLSVDLETAGPCLIRAYDTRFLQVLSACQPDQMAELAGVDSTWIWSVDLLSHVQWSGFQATGVAKQINTHKGRDFERLLGWAFGWPSCLPYVDRDQWADATTLTRFIVNQWRSGTACDSRSVELEAQWQAFRTGESDAVAEPGNASK